MEWSGNTFGITLSGSNTEPTRTPGGLVTTRAIEVKDGWVGQVIIGKAIVWQSDPVSQSEEDEVRPETAAVQLANARVIDRLTGLFA